VIRLRSHVAEQRDEPVSDIRAEVEGGVEEEKERLRAAAGWADVWHNGEAPVQLLPG